MVKYVMFTAVLVLCLHVAMIGGSGAQEQEGVGEIQTLPDLVLLACVLEDSHLRTIKCCGEVLPLLRVETLGAVL